MVYAEDSFFSLTPAGQAGLALVSVAMSVAMIWLSRRMTRKMTWPARVLTAIVLFWGFVWLSPQAYYSYYMLLFEDLPVQSVIKAPPGFAETAQLLTFTGPATLSAHSKGIMALLMICAALWPQRKPAPV